MIWVEDFTTNEMQEMQRDLQESTRINGYSYK